MEWKDFWLGIQYLFEEILFVPLDWLRELQFDSWYLANMVSWVFLVIFFAAFGYWMKQIKLYNEDESESASHTI